MDKFDTHDLWKHNNCLDAFFYVTGHHGDYLVGCWMIQGIEKYWTGSDLTKIKIDSHQIEHWQLYEPRGEFYV